MRIVILAVMALFLFGCTTEQQETVEVSCPDVYQPVCSVNNVTYPNECAATQAGIEIQYPGECRFCTENDGGINQFQKGTTNENVDFCIDNKKLTEYYCVGIDVMNKTITCEGECSDGKCITVEKPVCSDTDAQDIYNKGTVKEGKNIFIDECVDVKVKEYYCGEFATSKIFECPEDFECDDGQCKRINRKCSDSDGGYNIQVGGTLTISGLVDAVYIDKCVDDDTLWEYSCVADDMHKDIVDCNGSCIRASCLDVIVE